jgi:hypothetical protein
MMSESEIIEVIKLASIKFKNILLHPIDALGKMSKSGLRTLDQSEILTSDLMGYVGSAKWWEHNYGDDCVKIGHIRVSNQEAKQFLDIKDWSPDISFEQFDKCDRVIHLKTFW